MKLTDIMELLPKKAVAEKKREPVLRIDCGKCERDPDYGNAVCIRCISRNITDDYRPESIILDSGVEKEYSGEAARLMCDLSRCVPHEFPSFREKKCAECKASPLKMDDEMWNLFSIDAIDMIIAKLDNTLAEGNDCEKCINETKNRLQETRNRLYIVSKDALATAYRLNGV